MRLYTLTALGLFVAMPVMAADMLEQHLTIKDKAFSPAEITIPADQKVKLMIKNEDATAAEWESHSLHREKIVPAHKEISVIIGPVKAGTYEYFNEFHPSSTGKIIAR